ncbi:MAG: geranylgeranylglycerol-phosphate geranylgeranyltransferase [Thermoplasmata archaeon]
MQPVLRLIRVGNVAVSLAGTIVGGLAAAGGGVAHSTVFYALLLLAALSTGFVTAGGNVLNDLLDVETDRVNHPDRPLVTGAISRTGGRTLAISMFVAGVAVAIPVVVTEPLVGLLLALAIGALLGYEFRLKAHGFAGNLTVAFLTGLVFLYGGAAAANAIIVAPFAVMAFLATLSREVIKDMEDAGGDTDRRTLPQTKGFEFATGLARGAVVIAIVLSFLPLVWFVRLDSAAGIMYLVLVLAADALFAVSVAQLPARLHWEQTVSKVAMSVALLAFLAVAFR